MSDEKKIGKGKAGPGRPKGRLNNRTLIGKSVAETLKNMLGFDDESVQRTGQIDREGYGARLRLAKMLRGERDVDPAFIGALKFTFAYAFGSPRRMEADTEAAMARRLAFITARGLPWQQDPLALRESQMLQQQETEAALQVELSKKQAAEAATGTPTAPEGEEEALQLVRSFDLKEPQ